MKRFLALAALVLGMVSCQTEPEGLDVIVGGEVDTTITVAIPEAETRSSANSAVGIFNQNGECTEGTMRYILQVYHKGETNDQNRQVKYSTGTSVSFPVRLVPGRDYQFVVWADVVDAVDTDSKYYDTSDLTNITLKDNSWNAMDEKRDAFTATYMASKFNGSQSINIPLYRPFAKLRIVATDYDVLAQQPSGAVVPHHATVKYYTDHRVAFNAYTGKAADATLVEKEHNEYVIKTYSNENDINGDHTIFSDYFFAENDIVRFEISVYTEGGELIKKTTFPTDINVRRNYLTTLKGDVLTVGGNVGVTVLPGIGGADEPDYNYTVVTSAKQLIDIANAGGQYKIGADLVVDPSLIAQTSAITRTNSANEPKVTTIDLNGYTVTVKNTSDKAVITVAEGNKLVFEGKGVIELTNDSKAPFIENTNGVVIIEEATLTNNSTNQEATIVDGTAVVNEGVETKGSVVSGETTSQLDYVLANGGEVTLLQNVTSDKILDISATNPVVINGANFTLTTTATRAIRVTPSKANVTINDLNIVVATERVYPNDIRGISLDPGLNGVDLTLNNCSVDFTHKTGNDWSYAVNVSGNGTGHKVTINGGTYNGANVVNVHGANNTIVVKNATLTSLYPDTANYISSGYYGACIWVLQNQGSSVYAEGNTFNGNNAMAFNLGTGTTLEEKDNIDNTMFYYDGTCYVGSSEKFQKAIAEGANNIVLGKGTFDLPSSLTQTEGTLTIKGRGNDVTVLNGAVNTNGNHPGNYANGVALVFEGLTFKTANNGYNGGFGHAVSVTFRESKIVGQFYAHSSAPHYFYDCTIDPLTGYLYTYGSDCVFEGCTFAASEGKALQIYEDAASGENTVTITNCAFVAAKQATTWDGKPVTGIDINSNGAKFEVYINNCTTTGFPTGLNSNSNLWNVKDAGKAHANVYVDGVQVWFAGFETVAEGLLKKDSAYVVMNAEGLAALNTMMVNKTAGKGVMVTLAADIDFAGKTWTPVDSHADSNFTFTQLNGNGYTLSNLTINGQAMFTRFAGTGNVTIKNVTFDNANVNSKGNINTSILTGHTYQNVLLDNVDVKNSTIIGGYKVAPLIATVYNEGASTITATLKNCDVENTVVKATSYDFGTTGMVAFVYEGDNDRIVFENCSVKDVQLSAPNVYTAHAAIYTAGSETLYNEAEGVTVTNVTFENI